MKDQATVLADKALEAWGRLSVPLNAGRAHHALEGVDLAAFAADVILIGDVLVALQAPDQLGALREIAEDLGLEGEVSVDHCEDCGLRLAPNDIHAGLTLCFNCDPPWHGTEG